MIKNVVDVANVEDNKLFIKCQAKGNGTYEY